MDLEVTEGPDHDLVKDLMGYLTERCGDRYKAGHIVMALMAVALKVCEEATNHHHEGPCTVDYDHETGTLTARIEDATNN